MPELQRGDARIHYEVYGEGYPLLAIAPGFLSSRIERWRTNPSKPGQPQDFLDPIAALSDRFQIITLDARNAGASRAPVGPDDSWHSYVADFLAVIDHLGVTRCAVMGACIGVSFAFAIAEARPSLVSAIVLQNPIGLHENRDAIEGEIDAWEAQVRNFPGFDPANLPGFRKRMFGNDFLFAISRDFVASVRVPILLMPGNDTMHPAPISDEIASLAPQTEVVAPWKGDGHKQEAMDRVREFLIRNEPAT